MWNTLAQRYTIRDVSATAAGGWWWWALFLQIETGQNQINYEHIVEWQISNNECAMISLFYYILLLLLIEKYLTDIKKFRQ